MAREPEDAHPYPTRSLLVCDYFLKYTLGLAQGMRQNGCEVTVLGRDHAGEFGGDQRALEREIDLRLGLSPSVQLLKGRVRDLRAAGQAVALRSSLRRGKPVVHLQDGVVNDPRLPLVAGAWPGSFALTVHDPVPHPGDEVPSVRKRLARAALLRSARVVFVHGQALADELRSTTTVHAPVEVIPHGADPPRPAPWPTRPSLLIFGRLSHYKGVDVALDAMAQVWASVPESRLVIAGEGSLSDHPALADPRVVVRNEHIAEEDLPQLFAEATAVLLPYRQASQSGVGSVVKSFARPLIVTDVGGLPELVSDGSGLLVAPESPEELARAAVKLLREPLTARRLGEAGARTAATQAGWRQVGELTLEAYRRHGLLRAAADGSYHPAIRAR